MRRKGFTLIELLVVIAIIAMLLAILMPALNKVKKIAQRVICGTNLKGLGTAQNVYANDYEDQFAKQGGTMQLTWANTTGAWFDPAAGWQTGGQRNITVGASLYLLVREADVSPKSFVCPSGGQTAYEGEMPTNATQQPDLVELWDFGGTGINKGPRNCVSYSYQDPYGRYAASGSATASFAMMADKNPYFDPKLQWSTPDPALADTWTSYVLRIPKYWLSNTQWEKWQLQAGNAYPHSREGQNVLFGDGHSAFEKTSDVGVRNDNIYTKQAATPDTDNAYVRCGLTNRSNWYSSGVCQVADVQNGQGLEPTTAEDSLLVNDDFAE